MGNFTSEADVAAGLPDAHGQAVVVQSVEEADTLLDNAFTGLIAVAERHIQDLQMSASLSNRDRNLLVGQATNLCDQLIDLAVEIDHAHVQIHIDGT